MQLLERLPASQMLRRKIDLVRPGLREASGAIWNHPKLASLFPEFLITVHQVIRATVPALQTAASCARARGSSDLIAMELAEYFEHHAAEEVGHDEWLLEDIAALGVSRDEVLCRLPSPAVAALVGSQYYWMFHHHPIAYLGYTAVLEGPASVEYLESAIKRTGLPEKAFSTLLHHARLDAGHESDLDVMLDRLPLGREHESILGVSAFSTVALMARVHQELAESWERYGREAAQAAQYNNRYP